MSLSVPIQFPARVYRVNTLLHASREKFVELRQAIEDGRRRDVQRAEQEWRALREEADRVAGGHAG